MTHYRIIGRLWGSLGVVGFVASILECVRLTRANVPFDDGAMVSTILDITFCAVAVIIAEGLFHARSWARASAVIFDVLLFLYCLCLVMLVGLALGTVAYVAAWIGVAFATYTLVVISIVRPHKPAA